MTINFSGTTLADLTEGLANAATRESNTTAAQTSTFAMTNTDAAFATNYEVVGLGVCARSSRGSSGVGYVKPAVYSNVTLGTGTSTQLDVTWGRAYHIFTQDPDTATTWTVSGIDAAELGVQSSAS